ncbi:hypothetical protein PR048_003585 [Dryococelus australis]|uniref:DUF5641 domain-containing protein n=1 Tax=Dryococelus australis TaxID=614101 RepID=A0ABQ9IPU9_9NEOP|nr:hypothetical protein PR048_003585 [Dryococelus australis]
MINKLLRRILGCAALHYEELLTEIFECEAMVNSRPLTYVSEDPRDLKLLTPAMFLQETCTRLRADFRSMFRAEYLSQLLQCPKKARQHELKTGEIVLLENENQGRIFWPLARVVEVYPGRDGNTSVVKVTTSSGELVRPVQRIYPLEISAPVDELKA